MQNINPVSSNLITQPSQKKNSSQKTKKWHIENIDYGIAHSMQTVYNNRTSREKKLINYDLVNSKFDPADFDYITNPYGLPSGSFEGIPLQIFNVVRSKVERLKGEEIQRAFGFMAIGVEGEVVKARDEARKKVIREYLQKELQAAFGQAETDEQGNPISQPELEKIIKDFDKNFKDIREQWVNKILNYLKYRERLELKFNEGWEHALIAGEEIYRVGIINGEPALRVVNPPNFWCDVTPNMKRIQDSDIAVEVRIMSKGQILDEYGDLLDPKDLNKIDSGDMLGYSSSDITPPGFMTPISDLMNRNPGYNNRGINDGVNATSAGHFKVYCVTWKSWKKWGFLTYIDENGESQQTTVEDDFSLDEEQKEAGWSIEWAWKSEIREGYRINDDIYFGWGALQNQIDGELPYVGRIYNSLNTESTSLVELIKPYQYLHTVVWHKLKKEAAKAKGKKQVMDLSQIPKSQGIDLEKWMYYYDELDIAFINSMEEGREGDPTSVSKFNQFTSIDMTMSNNVIGLMQLLDKIENSIDSITGISKQREGDIGVSETATNAGRAITQSTYITEPLFYIHSECKKEVLDHLIKVAKTAYINGKTGQFLMGDKERVVLEIDGDLLNDSDYSVFLTNSPRDKQLLEELKALANIALQSDKANLSDIVSMIESTSISEVKNIIIEGEQDKIARDQQAAEDGNNTMLQQTQMNIQAQKDQRDWEAVQRQLDRENKLQISQTAQLGLSDTDNDGTLDILELGKIQSKEKETLIKADIEMQKIQADKEKQDKQIKADRIAQDKDIKAKTQIERFKVRNKPKPKKS